MPWKKEPATAMPWLLSNPQLNKHEGHLQAMHLPPFTPADPFSRRRKGEERERGGTSSWASGSLRSHVKQSWRNLVDSRLSNTAVTPFTDQSTVQVAGETSGAHLPPDPPIRGRTTVSVAPSPPRTSLTCSPNTFHVLLQRVPENVSACDVDVKPGPRHVLRSSLTLTQGPNWSGPHLATRQRRRDVRLHKSPPLLHGPNPNSVSHTTTDAAGVTGAYVSL
ncbi:unnamed protein product [Pleuronectes platessa]|uniref:Uncharacterized protein n=1 Tax=Pleuronectes platessa TaxID=8262 RepID=A0A9N7TV64_PLEPL|nr:unnamed protein product [Pleuronectes platessa]